MKGYWVSAYRSVKDPEKLAAYAAAASPLIVAADGRFIARGGRVEVFEAGIEERTVLIEFDSFEKALATYHSQTYQAALAILGDSVERDLRIIEGLI